MASFLFHPVYTDVAMKIIFSRSAGSYVGTIKRDKLYTKSAPKFNMRLCFGTLAESILTRFK